MSDRPLTVGEKALWQKFIETVTPLEQVRVKRVAPSPKTNEPARISIKSVALAPPKLSGLGKASPQKPAQPRQKTNQHGGLDGRWDRRLAKGTVHPDVTVDLHGHSLTSAHGRLDSALELSIAAGHRTILLITGKPRKERDSRHQGGRGAIRAAISHWLAVSRHAGNIAAVRGAHPRHGGTGALYIILRRRR